MGRRRTQKLRAAAHAIGEAPVLLDGDAGDLLTAMRRDADEADIAWFGRDSADGVPPEGVGVAVIVVAEQPGRSGFVHAAAVLRQLDGLVRDDAVRVVVLQRQRTTTAPEKVLQLLGDEILLQIVRALPGADALTPARSMRQRAVQGGLRAAGLSVLRFA